MHRAVPLRVSLGRNSEEHLKVPPPDSGRYWTWGCLDAGDQVARHEFTLFRTAGAVIPPFRDRNVDPDAIRR
jgi:hypothetical protein